MMSKKLIVDVDCGVDDAQAIMLALAAPNVELLGITCVHGNTTVENVCKNTLRVLQVCGKLEVSKLTVKNANISVGARRNKVVRQELEYTSESAEFLKSHDLKQKPEEISNQIALTCQFELHNQVTLF